MSALGMLTSLPSTALSLFKPHSGSAKLGTSTATGIKSDVTNGTATAGATGSATSSTNIGSTFLNLLVKELQNQDPTAPMDSTAMVGQMISLNQLDQLIAINQSLTPAQPSTSTGKAHSVSGIHGNSSAQALAERAQLLSGQLSPLAAASPTDASPLAPETALQTAASSQANAAALNLSGLNSIFGGK